MRQLIRTLVACGVAASPSSGAWAGQYVMTVINAPGMTNGFATGINNLGVVVGDATINGVQHGFIWQNGQLTVVNATIGGLPAETNLYSINDNGEAVGGACTIERKVFFCKPMIVRAGGVTEPSVFGKRTMGQLFSINNAGQVAGGADGNAGPYFIFKPGAPLTLFDPPLINPSIQNINRHGVVVGSGGLSNSTNPVGFLYENGQITTFAYPGATGTYPNFISEDGAIVGAYAAYEDDQAFMRLPDGTFRKIKFPDSPYTEALLVGPGRQVFGQYLPHEYGVTYHAFSQLDKTYTTLFPSLSRVYLSGVNAASSVVGYYFDQTTNLPVPFVATCPTGPATCTE